MKELSLLWVVVKKNKDLLGGILQLNGILALTFSRDHVKRNNDDDGSIISLFPGSGVISLCIRGFCLHDDDEPFT